MIRKYQFKGELPCELPKLDTWDFVQHFYPKYTSSGEIAQSDDLQKLVDKEMTRAEYKQRYGSLPKDADTECALYEESAYRKAYQAFTEGILSGELVLLNEPFALMDLSIGVAKYLAGCREREGFLDMVEESDRLAVAYFFFRTTKGVAPSSINQQVRYYFTFESDDCDDVRLCCFSTEEQDARKERMSTLEEHLGDVTHKGTTYSVYSFSAISDKYPS